MADDNIHELFRRSDDAGLGSIDTASVIRRSKRRRLPAQLATGGALVLALGGFGVFGVQALVNSQAQYATTAGGMERSDGDLYTSEDLAEGESGVTPQSATDLNLCGAPLTLPDASPSGLELTVSFPDAAVGTEWVEGIVTLTNNGSTAVTGTTAASPQITLSQNGVVTWHSNGAMIAMAVEVDLAPGESFDYVASFTPVTCGPEDDAADGFRENLPASPAGAYQVSAAIDLLTPDAVELVGGPAQTITLD